MQHWLIIIMASIVLSACESDQTQYGTNFSKVVIPDSKSPVEMNNQLSTDLLYRFDVIDLPAEGRVSRVEGNCSSAPYLGKVYKKIEDGEVIQNDTMVVVGIGCFLQVEVNGHGAVVFDKAPDIRRVIFKVPGKAI